MRILIAAALFGIGSAAIARDLPVPPDKGWQHATTGLVLMPIIAGEQRTALTDSGERELDVAAQYGSGDGPVSITIYLFRPGLDDVALWFDRVDTEVRGRDTFGGVTPAAAAPVAFSRPGSAIADSLRMVYTPQKGPYHSTGAAMMPLGDWLVSVRISSKLDNAQQLAAKLDAVIAGIRFPKDAAAGPVVAPIAECRSHINYHHAKMQKVDPSQVLFGAIEGSIAEEHSASGEQGERIRFCRDGTGTTRFGVYRQDDSSQSYWVAFNDAGQAAFVSSGLGGLIGKGGFQVKSLTFDGIDVFPSFDKLPEPQQVIDLIGRTEPLSHTAGKTITLSNTTLS